MNQTRPKAVDFLSDTEDVGGSGSDDGDGNESDDMIGGPSQADSDDDGEDGESGRSEGEDDADADAPRISQWVDDETLGEGPVEEDSEGSDEDGEDVQVRSLKNNLSTLPLGALRKAQRSLAQAQALSDSDTFVSESESSDGDNNEDHREAPPMSLANDKGKGKHKELPKRPHKHAPTEISSKRPVTRRRTVVEDTTPKPRDPRFTHASGQLAPDKFRTQYTFLSDLHTGELAKLREDYKRARKLLANSPRELRAAREEEVRRLERAVKRAESSVNRDKREKVEAEALSRAKQAESERRKLGKGAWFMKESEKKDLLNKARFDAIAASGGKQAVKKAIEKKQKKISQKEKRSRPFARGSAFSQGADSGGGAGASSKQDGRKRRAGPGDSTNRGAKRRKVA